MFSYILLFTFVSIVALFWEHISQGLGHIRLKYNQLNTIRSVIKQDKMFKNKNLFKLVCGMIWSFMNVICVSYCQTKLKSFCLRSVDKNTFEITLCIRNRIIKYRVIIPRGPGKIIHVLGDEADDLTDEIEPYLNYNTRQLQLKDVSECKAVEILLSDGESKSISTEDVLSI